MPAASLRGRQVADLQCFEPFEPRRVKHVKALCMLHSRPSQNVEYILLENADIFVTRAVK